jgi:hypothetical protein
MIAAMAMPEPRTGSGEKAAAATSEQPPMTPRHPGDQREENAQTGSPLYSSYSDRPKNSLATAGLTCSVVALGGFFIAVFAFDIETGTQLNSPATEERIAIGVFLLLSWTGMVLSYKGWRSARERRVGWPESLTGLILGFAPTVLMAIHLLGLR